MNPTIEIDAAARAAAIAILRDLRDVFVFDGSEQHAAAQRAAAGGLVARLERLERLERYEYTVRVTTLKRFLTVFGTGDNGAMLDDDGPPVIKIVYPAVDHTDTAAFTEALRGPLRTAVLATQERVDRARATG